MARNYGRNTKDQTALRKEIEEYWNSRSHTYSNSVKDELEDYHFEAWTIVLEKMIAEITPSSNSCRLKILDLGCGPGFFEIIFSRLGCLVDAVDGSDQMIDRAHCNVVENGVPGLVTFHHGDASNLPFPSCAYDVVVSRNVTWLMQDPLKAYAEWNRVLKLGGKLLVFDANWYSYLIDKDLNRKRLGDQKNSSILKWSESSFATNEQERECEVLALHLPLTYERRPSWDAAILPLLGFSDIRTDEEFSKHVWNEGERTFYATSPLFSIEAFKAHATIA